MTLKNIIKVCLFAVVVLSTTANAAQVRSISREVKNSFDDETVWTVYVKCAGVTEERSIERSSKNLKWCSEDLPTLCGRQKVQVANKICGMHFERLVIEHRIQKAKEEAFAGGQ